MAHRPTTPQGTLRPEPQQEDDLRSLQQDPDYLRWRDQHLQHTPDDGAMPGSQFACEMEGWRDL